MIARIIESTTQCISQLLLFTKKMKILILETFVKTFFRAAKRPHKFSSSLKEESLSFRQEIQYAVGFEIKKQF